MVDALNFGTKKPPKGRCCKISQCFSRRYSFWCAHWYRNQV